MKAKSTTENGFESICNIALEDDKVFEFGNGLWKGKKEPFVKVNVLRNTNFNNDGTLSFDDVAELDVELKQFSNRRLIKEDIILERSGGGPEQPVGRVVFFDKEKGDYSFSNFTTRIRVKDTNKIKPKYLLYYLLYFYQSGGTYDLQQRTTGIRNLNFSDYKKVVIPLLEISEQQKISFVLSKIQQAIEQQNKIIQITKELKKSLMNRLFSEGLHGEEQKETEIGMMPKRWEVIAIGECLTSKEIKVGKIKQQDFGKIGKYPIVDQGQSMVAGYSDDESKVYQGDLPVIIFGDHTRILKYIDFFFICGADGTKILLPRKGINPKFFFYALSDVDIPSRGYNRHYRILRENKISLPSIDEQKQIANILSSVDTKLSQAEARKQTLQSFFKTMLNQLMTGRIRVKDLDIEVN